MSVSILVVTPHTAFGELIRNSLEERSQYQVCLVHSAQEARAAYNRESYQLAICDSSVDDEPFVPLCRDLLEKQKGIRLVVVPPENNPSHPALGGLIPHGYLSYPFYLPDLLETVSRLINQQETERTQPAPLSYTLPPWLTDPVTLQRYLTSEMAKTQAKAGFIGASSEQGSQKLLASAGPLSPETVEELASVVFRYMKGDEKTDLMRFIRLADRQDFLVYATPITGDLMLILVYDPGEPISQVRPQTKSLAQKLAALPPEGFIAGAYPPVEDAEPQAHHPPAAEEPKTQPVRQPSTPSTDEAQDEPAPGGELDWEVSPEAVEDDDIPINLASLLGPIPSPDPGKDTLPRSSWLPSPGAFSEKAEIEPGSNGSSMDTQPDLDQVLSKPQRGIEDEPLTEPHIDFDVPTTGESSPAAAEAKADKEVQDEGDPSTGEKTDAQSDRDRELAEDTLSLMMDAAKAAPAQAQPGEDAFSSTTRTGSQFQVFFPSEPPVDPLEDTRPRATAALSSVGQLEPVSPGLALLKYTCVLVPRFPHHYLTGELPERLQQWIQQLSLAFGWRLEAIAVRPEYLQWTVQVAPSVSPGNIVRVIRQRTSQNIFSQYEHLRNDNPSGDFWATGYLIVSGAQPPSAQLLRDYIAQTRKRQGID
ncbi:MAG: IS200/IS605 family transposase [Chloroflexi bacterium]|nr:IS200/IS605 family transposase [Chloroflexota bacterium]